MTETLRLRFLGFQINDPAIAALYDRSNPNDPDRLQLPGRHRLERDNPTIFSQMYQFWVRAPLD